MLLQVANCGRSSGVERNLAKVDVVSSNLIARSMKNPSDIRRVFLLSLLLIHDQRNLACYLFALILILLFTLQDHCINQQIHLILCDFMMSGKHESSLPKKK